MTSLRIGHGFDVHAFEAGDHIVLGGVRISHTQGLRAHSDGDVALHALCDALLGAAALGDIGKYFPDTKAEFKDADSRELLRHVIALITGKKYSCVNVDITIVAQAPKLSDYIETMCINIADDLRVKSDCVNIKATTTEKLGYTGRGEGISSHAVVLIDKNIDLPDS